VAYNNCFEIALGPCAYLDSQLLLGKTKKIKFGFEDLLAIGRSPPDSGICSGSFPYEI
jgi:hypothetical protein